MAKLDLGEAIYNWKPPPIPGPHPLQGRYTVLNKLSVKDHAQSLWENLSDDQENAIWNYLPYGPFNGYSEFVTLLETHEPSTDPYFFAIDAQDGRGACGVASYLRIKPQDGSIEIGHIFFTPCLQRTRAATEAIFLMINWAFENGYRRVEWKCNALNQPSMRAAKRFGFTYEGTFRQATVIKGHNRDSAWFSVIDKEWPKLASRFVNFLNPTNFDKNGMQRLPLELF